MDLTTERGMRTYLVQTRFPNCKNVVQLTGGSSAFVYRVATGDAGTPSVVAKHAEGYASGLTSWKLDQDRMVQCPYLSYQPKGTN